METAKRRDVPDEHPFFGKQFSEDELERPKRVPQEDEDDYTNGDAHCDEEEFNGKTCTII